MTGQHGGFRPGSGRPKGAKNKRTLEVEEKIWAHGCPFESMWRVAKRAEGEGDLSTAGRLYGELGRYVAPQRKAVDLNGDKAPKRPEFTLDELASLKEAILSGAFQHGDLIN